MLSSLHIKNYALIEEVNLQFNEGFTVITGETGAGKSILLGALGLILGKRADISSIGNTDEKCVIEAHFNVSAYDLKVLFEEEDLDYESLTIIRREILSSGKSRAFVNDTPVTLSQLSALGARLVDIHSQHQTLEVTDVDFQFQVLDAFAENESILSNYQELYQEFRSKQSQLKKKRSQKEEAQKEEEYKTFLLEELLAANLKAGEQENIEASHEALNNVEQITEGLAEAYQILSREEVGVNEMLLTAKVRLAKLSSFSTQLKELSDRLEAVTIELDDISESINDLAADTESDPTELAHLESRLKMFFDLQKKHQVDSVEGLIEIRDTLDDEVQSLSNLDSEINNLEREIAQARNELEKQAVSLTKRRTKTIKPLTEKLQHILLNLGMPNARFEVSLTDSTTFLENGKDQLYFLFTANKGMRAQELKKAASGGELSRIMLAIKSVLSDYAKLPTLIFDEIDTGVSGEVALKMGHIMKDMGSRMQLISITHLPQIAGQGANHLKVYKEDLAKKTTTGIRVLSTDERVAEIAEMLGGKASSDAAFDHARQLLN
ncbi:DNA replication and repair protein RecN [Leeuwenhoekiella aestuarii]|uniref:DNA repair protein RecN n=1 Tax=Leeuwenhoekiella aestuarii TaxID=2249426 RepID=A0A4Q0NXI3_9FLAO|nr:DNA repair protein RecN [Leeuwenhoekiella aestuarii]RXG15510.1 DNA replication and repair protein RecN [Leeuwenhoekiella aestuarii]RXG17383.1 DNA replication and repair protein RecN [Leeuwenhoekiella aestuarii]